MDSLARAAMAGSVNWARKDSMDAVVVSVESPSRISTRMVDMPARESQKAVATPMIPPPMTTASADSWLKLSGVSIFLMVASFVVDFRVGLICPIRR